MSAGAIGLTLVVAALAYVWTDLEDNLFPGTSPVVQISTGQLEGSILHSRSGREFLAFKGIPYAKPPVGNLRFESPEPAGSWDGIRPAMSYGSPCFQYEAMATARTLGDEDCLFLNVFSPNLTGNFPVMVWIHGGGFVSGAASDYNPKYFLDENIVLVTLNYRLGPLGFLNTGDSHIKGNMGLKDQNMALQWVQTNIAQFGGNKDKVTIFGESAGGASVSYHLVSPLSKGLFQKAISQSGNVFCPWARTRNPRNQAIRFGKQVGCAMDDTKLLTDCLKKLDKDKLKVNAIIMNPDFPQDDLWVGSIEKHGDMKNAFLTENPADLLATGRFNKVPLIIGFTSGEGGLKTSRIEGMSKETEFQKNWEKYAPSVLHYNPDTTSVTKKLKDRYFASVQQANGEANDMHGFLKNYTRMLSEGLFFQPTLSIVSFHMKYSPVYLYYYTYDATIPSIYSLMKAVRPNDLFLSELYMAKSAAKDAFNRYILKNPGHHEFGVMHADDLLQLFSMNWILEIGQSSPDYEFSRNLIKTWTAFASDENPLQFDGVKWFQTNPGETLSFMNLDREPKMMKNPFEDVHKFWSELGIRDHRDDTNW